MRVAQVITGLETGGAEMLLATLATRLAAHGVEGPVITLGERGPLADSIEAEGVDVQSLGIRALPSPRQLARVRHAIADTGADLVQTWLLRANVVGGLATPRPMPVVWGVHMSQATVETHGRSTIALQRLERALSKRVPTRIVATSRSANQELLERGYPSERIALIPNGFDTERFRPDRELGAEARTELGVAPGVPLVVHFARHHPMKDHANLLAAIPAVLERLPNARFLLCGDDVDPGNPELAGPASKLGAAVTLAGRRRDVRRLLCAADVAVLASATGEAMPVVIGEAMATAVPVVSTDVADARRLVGDGGRIVPVRDPVALGGAIADILTLPEPERVRLGEVGRERVRASYGIDRMVDGYLALWGEVAGSRTA